ncbi:MAG: hypothetical protein HUU37_00225 [Bdellovibrionales bacterium]|nr:hypothetical protein [Bdellovibrionales bacterium]
MDIERRAAAPGAMNAWAEESDWVVDLAESEEQMLRSGTFDMPGHYDKQKAVEHATEEFLLEMKAEFSRCADRFNDVRGVHSPHPVKVFLLSGTKADFLVLRGTVKLVVSNTAFGVVNLSFMSRATILGAAMPRRKDDGVDLIAQIHPFNEMVWTFQGESANAAAVVRYFFTELVRTSAVS